MKAALHAALFAAVSIGPATAAPVVLVDVTPESGGFRYAYTLSTDTPDEAIEQLILFDYSTIDTASITSPATWLPAVSMGGDFVTWVAVDDDATATLGRAVSGFSFWSADAPGLGEYVAVFSEENAAGDIAVGGPVTAPSSAVPEPSLVGLVGAGVAAALARRRLFAIKHPLRSRANAATIRTRARDRAGRSRSTTR